MRLALTATCITTLATLLAAQAHADTTVSGSSSTPLQTSTAGNITISSGATLSPPSGTAVTINSSNTVNNAGTISFTGVDNTTAIEATGGVTSGITSSGTITVNENYTRTDTNGDGVLDGPYANGTNRYGIRIDGAAPFTGAINNTGTITILGNNSAAIYAAAPIVGNVTTNTGAISVTGDNIYGVRLGAVTGNIAISSAIATTGGNATGLALTGDVTGQVVVHGSITNTGYSSTTLPTGTLGVSVLTPQNLEQSQAAMIVGGNVTGGVLIAAAPTDTTNTTADLDFDGIADAGQATSTITNYGAAPALQIGSATAATTLGVFQGTTTGLIINGSVNGVGVYSGIGATGVQIGGLGGNVTINGGIAIAGTVSGSSNGAFGVALHLNSGASTPALTVSGTVAGAASATQGGYSVGVQIDAGASLPTITNTGSISAITTASTGPATAILDNSGTLTSVTNAGTINGSSTDGTGRAIDVSAQNTSFTYTQALATSTQTVVPSLTGQIVTGSGNDVINISAGNVNSIMNLGDGNNTISLSGTTVAAINAMLGAGNDSVTISDTASYSGPIDFGGGNNSLTINSGARFTGEIDNGGSNIAVRLNGGTMTFNNVNHVDTIGSLAVTGGTIGVVVDPSTGAHTTLNVTGATTISGPTTLAVSLTNFGVTASPLNVIQSGTLAGSSNLSLSISQLPYLLDGSIVASDTAGTVGVAIQRKTAAELGLRRSEAAAYDAVFAAIQSNSALSTTFLGLTDRPSTLLRYDEMLPDHQGGVFDVLTQGARQLAPTEAATPWAQLGHVSLWVQQAIWDEHQDADQTPGNGGSGWGLTAGGDVAVGNAGRIGVSLGYIHGDVRNSGDNEVTANQWGGGVHWLSDFGRVHFAAYGTAGYVRFGETRAITGTTGDTSPSILTSKGHWNGLNAAAGAKLSYEAKMGAFYLRPSGEISYNRLSESAHDESGGGVGFDLSVDKRKSSELAGTGLLAAGVHLGNLADPEATTFRLEVQGGRRQIINSKVGATTANFSGGSDFTLLPEDRKSGWLGGLNASIGSKTFRFIASTQYETRADGQHILSGHFGFRGSF
jgi:hypothetical protein